MIKELALHRSKAIYGWMSIAELTFLAEKALDAKIIFEIGSFMGRSTRALADNTEGIIYAIDPWDATNYDATEAGVCSESNETVFNMFYCYNFGPIEFGRIIPCRSTWLEFNPPELADFIFIDGDHRYSAVKSDIAKALAYLKPGGVIAGHDYDHIWTGVVRAVDEFFDSVKVTDTIWSAE